MKNLFFSIVLINNEGMQGTYGHGDALVVKKCFNSYNNNDVVYFEFPYKDSVKHNRFFIQRICAGPGDSLEIREKEVFVNNVKDSTLITGLKHNYFIRTRKTKLDSAFRIKYNLWEGGEISEQFDYSYSLTYDESEALKTDSLILSVEIKSEKTGMADENCFPSNVNYPWNMDHYGKIYVPKKNDILVLDTMNINIYAEIIGNYESKKLEVRGDSILIDSQVTTKYIVEQDYYFVLGDNRSNSNDSRTWGFLPRSCIKGKVIARMYKARS